MNMWSQALSVISNSIQMTNRLGMAKKKQALEHIYI